MTQETARTSAREKSFEGEKGGTGLNHVHRADPQR